MKNYQISYTYEKRVLYIIFGLISWPWVDFQRFFSNYSLSTKLKRSLEKSVKFQVFIIIIVLYSIDPFGDKTIEFIGKFKDIQTKRWRPRQLKIQELCSVIS